MRSVRLRRMLSEGLSVARRRPVDPETLQAAVAIVEDVRERGVTALRAHAERLGDLEPGAALVCDRGALDRAKRDLPPEDLCVLERVAGRIRRFALAQRECLLPLDVEVDGGRAGHRWIPISAVGAYAPGGRYPLPSSVLMTVVPARVASVDSVWVASPRPAPITLAAAAVAGADGVLAVGGAQAIAALAFGVVVPPSDIVVGPGNRWVTAAKKHLVGEIGIDGLFGPSELVVLADATADARLIAADLLAQAEHDVDAVPILVTTSRSLVDAVDAELSRQLIDLPTASTAIAALERHGGAVCVRDLQEAVTVCNRFAPEHLELCVREPSTLTPHLRHYGALFLGPMSAEVFGDYGIGPNHVLPTGGGARFQAGLSVASFLRPATWLEVSDSERMAVDAAHLARLEGLDGHARAAKRRPAKD